MYSSKKKQFISSMQRRWYFFVSFQSAEKADRIVHLSSSGCPDEFSIRQSFS